MKSKLEALGMCFLQKETENRIDGTCEQRESLKETEAKRTET